MPFPYLVLDQNRMRCESTISTALDRCCRDDLRILLVDGAGFEFSKGSDPQATWQRSLQLVAPYPELVVVGRKISQVWRQEIEQGAPCDTLVDEVGTERFRALLQQLAAGDDSVLRELTTGPARTAMEASVRTWTDHDLHKRMIRTFRDGLQSELSPSRLSELRRNPGEAIAHWLESADGVRFVYQGVQSRSAHLPSEAALRLAVNPSAIGAFVSGMAAIALYWMAFGGLESAKPEIITNDILDLEYAIVGALSDSLLTSDRRLITIHQPILRGIEGRNRWCTRARPMGPEAA